MSLVLVGIVGGCEPKSIAETADRPTDEHRKITDSLTPRYESQWQAHSVWTAILGAGPVVHAQTTARIHLRPRGDGRLDYTVTIDRPFVRPSPHQAAAESKRVGDTVMIRHRLVDHRGDLLGRHQEVFDDPVTPLREAATIQLLAWSYDILLAPLPESAVAVGSHWNAEDVAMGAEWTYRLEGATADELIVAVEAERPYLTGELLLSATLRLAQPTLLVTSADLRVSFGWTGMRAPVAVASVQQTSAEVLPGPGYPRPIASVQQRATRCMTPAGEPGIVCTRDGLCCNPCLPGSATADGFACRAMCQGAGDCAVGRCDDGVCVYDAEPACPVPEPCTTVAGQLGRRCPGDSPCVAHCPPTQRLLGGTHCVKPCIDDADCPAGHCRDDGAGSTHCSGLCPSAGCPYLYP